MRPLPFASIARAIAEASRALDGAGRADVIARLLASIEREHDLVTAARWLSQERLGASLPVLASTLPTRIYAALSGDDVDEPGSLDHAIFAACRAMAGSALEAIRMILEAQIRVGLPPLVASRGLAVETVAGMLRQVAEASGSPAKIELLVELWRTMDPEEIAALHAISSRGPIDGIDDDVLAIAIARAFDAPPQLVRHAIAIDGDAGRAAIDARRGHVETTHVRPMQIVAPMHATPVERTVDDDGAIRLEEVIAFDGAAYFVEERLPGVRVQLHAWPSEDDRDRPAIALLAASGRDLSRAVPELADRLRETPGGTVIDGHLVVFDTEGAIVDATAIERSATRGIAIAASDALYVGFDLLVEDGISMLAQPLEERRFRLERIAGGSGLPVTRIDSVGDHDALERAYVETLSRGGLGIVAKRRDGPYEFGRRSALWYKAPGEPSTLLAVIRYAATAAEGRTAPPSELTFGVWLADDEEARLVNIGRADCALDDDELERLDRRLRRLRGKRFGPQYEIEPRIVCELEYDAIRVSPRTDAGYTIRIACIRCVRWELGIDDAASVADVAARHRAMLGARTLSEAVYVPG